MRKVLVAAAVAVLPFLSPVAPAQAQCAMGVPCNTVSAGDLAQNLARNAFSLMGDSRIAYTTVSGGYVLTSQSWFNAANARAGHRYTLVTNAGGSGCRSDQFLGPIDLQAILADTSGTVVINSAAANDFGAQTGNGVPAGVGGQCVNSAGSFPYTDNNGNTVTATNVGAMVAQNEINAAEALTAAGKFVILTEEPGTTTMVAGVNQVYDLNYRLRAYAASKPGQVAIWTYNDVVWNATGSTSAISFKTGYSTDGVHWGPIAADQQGINFNTAFQALYPSWDFSVSSINFINSTTTRSTVNNPLFNTLTGGTTSGCGTITGNVPSGWALNCHNSATTITITSAADANGYGNDITLAITTTGADTGVQFQSNAPSNSIWTVNDYLSGGADIAVTGTPSNACVYFAVHAVTGSDSQQYDMYPNSTTNCPNYAYTYRLMALAKQPPTGAQSFLIPAQIDAVFSAAGSLTMTVSRVWGARMYNYNPVTRTFAGQ